MILWTMGIKIILETTGKLDEFSNTFILTMSLALVIIAIIEWRRNTHLIQVSSFIIFSLFFLYLINDQWLKTWDYLCYENAAKAIVSGSNPYNGTNYLYPPLLAQFLSLGYLALDKFHHVEQTSVLFSIKWDIIFYLFEALQYVAVLIAYYLTYLFAKRFNANRNKVLVVSFGLFALNLPVVASLRDGEINIFVLDLILIAILTYKEFPLLSAFVMALGFHLKIYPLALILVFLILGEYKIVAYFALFVAILVAIGYIMPGGNYWPNFLQRWSSFTTINRTKDSGMDNFISSVVTLSAEMFRVVRYFIRGILLIWFYFRYKTRKKLSNINSVEWFYGNLFDAILLMLLASPVYYNQHSILLIPLFAFVLLLSKDSAMKMLPVIIVLTMLHTIDVFPFKFLNLFALIYLTVVTSPSKFNLLFQLKRKDEKSLILGIAE